MLNGSFGEEIPLPHNQSTTCGREGWFGGKYEGGPILSSRAKNGESLNGLIWQKNYYFYWFLAVKKINVVPDKVILFLSFVATKIL